MARKRKARQEEKFRSTRRVIVSLLLFFKKIGDAFLSVLKKGLLLPEEAYKLLQRIREDLYPSYSGLQQYIAKKRVRWIGTDSNVSLRSISSWIISAGNIVVRSLKDREMRRSKTVYQSAIPARRETHIRRRREKYYRSATRWILTIVPRIPGGQNVKFFFFGIFVTASAVFLLQSYAFLRSLPHPVMLATRDVPVTTKIYDRNDRLLYEIYSEQNRTPVDLSEIPDHVRNATIATEDKAFYTHQGFSLTAIMRSVLHNLTSNTQQGGSTITQQLIRSAFLTPEKTVWRKAKEILLAFWAERLYSKDQILEMYLNQVPYGATAWGIEAAAQMYFGKHIADVTLAQAAVLAGLPRAPSIYSPWGAHPENTQERRNEVLYRMVVNGYITKEQEQAAKAEELSVRTPQTAIAAPHFVMYVRKLLEEEYGQKVVETGGLRVRTTLDVSLQEVVQSIVSEKITELKPLSVGNGAALVTNPQNGEILAMVGSADYFDRQNNGNVDITRAKRQPGSSIKAVTYTAALENGFTAASILLDGPVSFDLPGQPPYRPVNYDGKFHGPVTLRTAFASSYNIPAVKTLAKIGVETMVEKGREMGVKSWEDASRFGLSLTLGGGEVTMHDMASIYGTLASGGITRELSVVLQVTNYRGEVLPRAYRKPPKRTVSEGIAFIVSDILSDNTARTPAFGPRSSLSIPEKTVAAKTGTSDNKRDNWTIGYTPKYTVTVWVGNNDNSPMDPLLTSGVTGAAPIWHDVMTYLLRNEPDMPFPIPESVVRIPCYQRQEYFVRGTEPPGGCPKQMPVSPTPSGREQTQGNGEAIRYVDQQPSKQRMNPAWFLPKNRNLGSFRRPR